MNSPTNQNDQIDYLMGVSGGTFTIRLLVVQTTAAAIITILIDGSSVGTVDLYHNPNLFNIPLTVTGIAISQGQHTISFKGATRNGSSGGWQMAIQSIAIWRTGA